MTTEVTLFPGIKGAPIGMGPIKVDISEDGELVRNARVTVGYGSRSIEKFMERSPYLVAQVYSDKFDFTSAPACNLGFSLSVEQLANITVPERAKVIRVILMELNRIGHHLFFISQMARLLGANNIFSFCLREREHICDVLEMYSGSRLGFGSIRIGGVCADLTEGMLFRIEKALVEIEDFVVILETQFLESPILIDRLHGLATISPEQAKNFGLVGPNARASGLETDLRIDRLDSGYQGIEIPPLRLATVSGDTLTRVEIRIAEIRQSIEILRGVTRRLPSGNVRVDIGPEFAPAANDAFTAVEGPKGALGFLVASTGGVWPANVRYSAPSLRSVLAFPKVILNQELADVELILCSLDISVSELDQ